MSPLLRAWRDCPPDLRRAQWQTPLVLACGGLVFAMLWIATP